VRWATAVALEIRASVVSRGIDVVLLKGSSIQMPLMLGHPFLAVGLVTDAAWSAAIGDAAASVNEAMIYTSAVKEGQAAVEANMHYGSVVGEVSAAPFAADKADAAIAEAVVHATVVADVGSPVASMKDVQAVVPSPIRRSPQVAGLGCGHPGAWNPIVAVVAIGPVAGRPHQAGLWAGGLLIDRQRRRRKPNADKYTGIRGRRDGREKKRQQ
jgi:hypothetical protein